MRWDFIPPIESDTLPPGLMKSVVRFISAQKRVRPEWLLDCG